MRIKYLGTAAAEGWPGLFCRCDSCKRAKELGGKNIRTRSQAIVDDTLLVDFPPDTYLHMLYQNVDLPNIHDVMITHTHQDHLYPDDIALRCKWFANDINGKLTLYGSSDLLKRYGTYMGTEAYHELLKDTLECREIVEYVTYQIGGYAVTPLLANHDKKQKCYIYLIEKEGKSLLYGNDTGYFPKETWEHLAGKKLDLVSLDCTMLALKDGNNHMGIADVLEVQQKLKELQCATPKTVWVITHFSHNGLLLHHEIEAAVNPHGFLVAYDGLEVDF